VSPARAAIEIDPFEYLSSAGEAASSREYASGMVVFSQGEPADAVFYIRAGKVKLSLLSPRGKEAIIALLETGDFFGEGSLAGQVARMATATTLSAATIARVPKAVMVRVMRERAEFADRFISHLLLRNLRFEEDLTDQLFNSSERRLARALLRLAQFGKSESTEPVIAKISQKNLAEMVGTTRSRVSFFMNKFRRLGLIEYGGEDELRVHSSLLNLLIQD
jgi:CRP/FNR family cyclic AMP-dependent transcriptional regulator